MNVIATKRGYFDHTIREEGTEFSIPDEPKGKDGKPVAFSKHWMTPAEEAEKAEKAEKPSKKGK